MKLKNYELNKKVALFLGFGPPTAKLPEGAWTYRDPHYFRVPEGTKIQPWIHKETGIEASEKEFNESFLWSAGCGVKVGQRITLPDFINNLGEYKYHLILRLLQKNLSVRINHEWVLEKSVPKEVVMIYFYRNGIQIDSCAGSADLENYILCKMAVEADDKIRWSGQI